MVEEVIEEGVNEGVAQVVTSEDIIEEVIETLTDETPDEVPETTDPDEDVSEDIPEVTDEDMDRMNHAYNYWHTHGDPQKAAVLFECIQQRRRPPANLIPTVHGIKPETAIDPGTLTVPPRRGPDADVGKWRAFAKKTLDMEPEIIDQMARNDLISLLENKKVIEKPDS